MDQTMNQNDHDLLIAISIGQQDLKTDMRAMADDIKAMKAGQESMAQRQNDLEARMTNISSTVQRLLGDYHDDHKLLSAVINDTSRWKLYMKIAAVMAAPIYIVIMALVVEAAKKLFIGP